MAKCVFCGSENIHCLGSRRPAKINVMINERCFCHSCSREFEL